MRLITAQVENYKIVEDSTIFKLEDVTCLVGKNESGKSAILQALNKLNPIEPADAVFSPFDFPRRRENVAQETGEISTANVLTTHWELEESDVSEVRSQFYVNPITSPTIKVLRGYANTTEWHFDIDEKLLVTAYVENSKLNEKEKTEVSGFQTVSELVSFLRALETISEAQTDLLNYLTEDFPEGSAQAGITAILEKSLPHFVYFSEYSRMPGKVSLEEVKRRRENGTPLSDSDKVFFALLDLANTTAEQFTTVGTSEALTAKLEGVSNRITDEIFEFWSQNQYLSVKFNFASGQPQDPSPFNSGMVFETRIFNERHRASVNFNERSTGFIWFFSFLVWFSQVKKHYGENLIILLDEPGLALHARAQGDLMRYIKEKLIPHYQVIYTTHSPFMVDPENLMSARTVEDRVRKDDRGRDVIEGTKVSGESLSLDADTLMPLQGALGYEISQTLFVGANTLLVEGPSDILYMQWMSSELRRLKRVSLSPRWTLSPSGGLDKVSSFVSLFSGKIKNIAVFTDFANGDKAKVEKLRKMEVLKAGHVLSADQYTGQSEADIEDMLGRASYLELIKRVYELKGKELMPATRPDDASERCLKEVEAHMRLLANKAEFDHFEPSRYFGEHFETLKAELPEFGLALDRFELLFKDLNALLPQP